MRSRVVRLCFRVKGFLKSDTLSLPFVFSSLKNRRIDRLLSSTSTSSTSSSSLSPLSHGLLLLDLSLLRRISLPLLSSHPSISSRKGKNGKRVAKRLRELWIEDLKELEEVGGLNEKDGVYQSGGTKIPNGNAVGRGVVDVGMGYFNRRTAVERMWNSWGSILSL